MPRITNPMEIPEMLKQSCLALAVAVCALGATAPQAAILSIDYAATITGGLDVNGTISWDTASSPFFTGLSFSRFAPHSASLFIGGVDYSGNMSDKQLIVVESLGNDDQFQFFAKLSGIAALPDAIDFSLTFFDAEGGLFNGKNSLPASVNALSGAETVSLNITGVRNGLPFKLAEGSATYSATPSTLPSVPEPGSLLLVALAGLALSATRRRSPAA